MKRVVVSVTAEDIKAGREGDECYCPIALAAARTLGRPVTVNHRNITVDLDGAADGNFWLEPLPPEAREFVEAFDEYREVAPFSFPIYMPTGGPTP